MPLTRKTVTVASRIMLPVHMLFSTALGVTWILQADSRTNTGALSLVRFWPIWATGTVLTALGAAVLVGLLTRKRLFAALGLGAGFLVYLGLAGLVEGAAFTAQASYSAGLWPTYVAFAHLASMVSLAHDELTDLNGNHGAAL